MTAGEKDGVSVAEALTEIMERHLPLEQVTTRSDGRKSYRRYYLHPSQVRAGGFRVHRIGTSGLSRRKVMVKRAKIKKFGPFYFAFCDKTLQTSITCIVQQRERSIQNGSARRV